MKKYLLLLIPLLMTGCVTTLLNIHVGDEITQTATDGSENLADQESNASDMLKDLVGDITQPAPSPGGVSIPVSPPSPPPVAPGTGGNGEPGGPDPEPDPDPGVFDFGRGFLWKPVSETWPGGRVLTPAELDLVELTVASARGVEFPALNTATSPDGRANPLPGDARGRQHWNLGAPGADYGTGIEVRGREASGSQWIAQVPNGADRFEIR